jgi:hypothetical protein
MSDVIDKDLASCAALELQHNGRSLSGMSLTREQAFLSSGAAVRESCKSCRIALLARVAEIDKELEAVTLIRREQLLLRECIFHLTVLLSFKETPPRADTPVQRETEKTT